MKIFNFITKLMCIFIALYILLCGNAYGIELKTDTPLIETDKKASLQMHYATEDGPLSDVKFKIFKVATASDVFYYTLINEFANYPVICNGLRNAEEWNDLANTLEGYILRDNIKAYEEVITSSTGDIKIEGLETGLYLVTGEKAEIGITTYSPEAFLVSLPNLDIDNEWNYEVSVDAKYNKFDDTSRLFDKKVIKVWEDDGYQSFRPSSVTIQLFRSGILYKEVVLNSDNGWSYVFKDLDSKYTYKIIEKEVDGYTVSINEEGSFYTVTNTYIKPQVSNPDVNGSTTKPTQSTKILPITGQVWWPICIFTILGIIFLSIGFIFDVRKKENEEK